MLEDNWIGGRVGLAEESVNLYYRLGLKFKFSSLTISKIKIRNFLFFLFVLKYYNRFRRFEFRPGSNN